MIIFIYLFVLIIINQSKHLNLKKIGFYCFKVMDYFILVILVLKFLIVGFIIGVLIGVIIRILTGEIINYQIFSK